MQGQSLGTRTAQEATKLPTEIEAPIDLVQQHNACDVATKSLRDDRFMLLNAPETAWDGPDPQGVDAINS